MKSPGYWLLSRNQKLFPDVPDKFLTGTLNLDLNKQPKHSVLTHISLASLLWDIGKQYSPRYDAAQRGVPSGAILFAQRNFITK